MTLQGWHCGICLALLYIFAWLVWYMAINAKYAQLVFEHHKLTILTKMSALDVLHNHLAARYNWKHILINNQLHLHFLQMQNTWMHVVVTMTMAVMVISIMDSIVLSCSSMVGCNRGDVKVCCLGWCATELLHLSCRLVKFYLMS